MNGRKPHEIASSMMVFLGSALFIFYGFSYLSGFLGIQKESLPATPSVAVKKVPIYFDEKKDDTSTLVFVGDIMLSRGVGDYMKKANDFNYPFLELGEFLKKADLTFGNLEGPISSNGTNMGSIYSFRADPKSVEGLVYSGFDVLSVANNHVWDYGPSAFSDTLQILKENNISPIGGGDDFTEAHTPVIKDVNGNKIAFLGYTNLLPESIGRVGAKPAVAMPDKDQMMKDIKNAKGIADIVIVSFHFGDEYKLAHNALQENLAHTAIDAGANMVVGHHPHVTQDTEEYNGGYIAYSLGNFVFDQNFSKETQSGMILVTKVKDKKIIDVEEKVVKFNSTFQPFLEEIE